MATLFPEVTEIFEFPAQTNWTTAVEILDEDTFLGAETNMNLYVCKRDASACDEVRPHMNEVAQFHLGEMVNVITKGSLVMSQPGDMHLPLNMSFLYGAVHGTVGVIVPIKQELYQLLNDVQNNLSKIIKSVGRIEHSFWRTFVSDRKVCQDLVNRLRGHHYFFTETMSFFSTG